MYETMKSADPTEIWHLLAPWVQVNNVRRFVFELESEEIPKITVEYYPNSIQAETIAILLKQYKLVEVTHSETSDLCQTEDAPGSGPQG